MQSTRDETAWGHRGGGGFARLHHASYRKGRRITQQNDLSSFEDLPSGWMFSSTSGGSGDSYSSMHPDSNDDADYNMQFVRQRGSDRFVRRKWQKIMGSDHADSMDGAVFFENTDVSSSRIPSTWYVKI